MFKKYLRKYLNVLFNQLMFNVKKENISREWRSWLRGEASKKSDFLKVKTSCKERIYEF